jgi:hypothetical protein
VAGLRAEVAILRAATGLDADDALDFDLRTAPAHPNLVGQRKKLVQPVVREPQHSEHLLLGQSLSLLEYPLPGDGQHVDLRPGHGLLLSMVCPRVSLPHRPVQPAAALRIQSATSPIATNCCDGTIAVRDSKNPAGNQRAGHPPTGLDRLHHLRLHRRDRLTGTSTVRSGNATRRP